MCRFCRRDIKQVGAFWVDYNAFINCPGGSPKHLPLTLEQMAADIVKAMS